MPRSQHSKAYRQFRLELRRAREAAGLTQIELATRLRKPQSVVSKVESGERRLDVVEFLQWAEAVGFDPHELIRRLRR
jgi:transcriptional regulator with XRE-family HTH domain